MEVQTTLLVLTLLVLGNVMSDNNNVSVHFSADPTLNVNEGLTVLLWCRVSGEFNSNADELIIQKNGGERITLATKEGIHLDAPENIFFAGWSYSNGVGNMYLSISNVSRADRGTYTCTALRSKDMDTNGILARETTTVDVLFVPFSEPSCNVLPTNQNLTYYDGDDITLRCISEAGNPPVSLVWFRTGDIMSLPDPQIEMSSDTIVSVMSLTLNTDFNGVGFGCIRQNYAVPSKPGSCYLGPFTVFNATKKATCTTRLIMTDDVIATIVIVAALVTLLIVVFVLVCFVRCRRKSPPEKRHSNSTTEKIPLEVTQNNATRKNSGLGSPATDTNATPPKGSQVYAVSQNNKTRQITSTKQRVSSKIYPDPPNYPRPPKNRESMAGKEYENALISRKSIESSANLHVRISDIPQTTSTEAKTSAVAKTGSTKDECAKVSHLTADVSNSKDKYSQLPSPKEPPPPPPYEACVLGLSNL